MRLLIIFLTLVAASSAVANECGFLRKKSERLKCYKQAIEFEKQTHQRLTRNIINFSRQIKFLDDQHQLEEDFIRQGEVRQKRAELAERRELDLMIRSRVEAHIWHCETETALLEKRELSYSTFNEDIY